MKLLIVAILAAISYAQTDHQPRRRGRRHLQQDHKHHALFHTVQNDDDQLNIAFMPCSDSDDGSSNAECGTGAFCDPLAFSAVCLVCPTVVSKCTSDFGILDAQGFSNCYQYCSEKYLNDRGFRCQYRNNGEDACSHIDPALGPHFCVIHPEWDKDWPNTGSGRSDDNLEGHCAPCGVVNYYEYSEVNFEFLDDPKDEIDPIGTLECLKWPYFQYDLSGVSCRKACEKQEYDLVDPYELDKEYDNGFNGGIVLSDLERFCYENDGKTGCCNFTWDGDDYAEVCEGDDYKKHSDSRYEREMNECGTRRCMEVRGRGRFCVLEPNNEKQCSRRFRDGNTWETRSFAGTCYKGQCLVSPESHCPDTYKEKVVALDPCIYTSITIGTSEPIDGYVPDEPNGGPTANGLCALITSTGAGYGQCAETPKFVKHLICESKTNYDKDDPTGKMGMDIEKEITSWGYMTYFNQYDTDIVRSNYIPFGSSTNTKHHGRCIIGFGMYQSDPPPTHNELNTLWEGSNCVITHPGEYVWRGMHITWWTSEVKDARRSVESVGPEKPERKSFLYIPVASKRLAPNFFCPKGKVCYGRFDCSYFTNPSAAGKPCGGDYNVCVPSSDPTPPPTPSPTPADDPETTKKPPTLHGDPIIWTLNGECYDLNKDGLYVASTHETFMHDVHIGVYNDFVRELQITDNRSGETVLTISATGNYFGEWPYGWKASTKKCPDDMKKTECVDTYMEFEFDVQDLNYLVQILRHDYKDPSLKEGELGFHLDVYPRTYDRFEKRKDGYDGAFFKNPLPNELDYCADDSPRRV